MVETPRMDAELVREQRRALGRMFRELKRKADLSTYAMRRALQHSAHMPPSKQIEEILSGEHEFSITRYFALLNRFGVTVRYFLPDGEEVIPPRS